MDHISKETLSSTADDILTRVEAGESFIIDHDDVPVAELRPYGGAIAGP